MDILFANNAKTLLDGVLLIGATACSVDDASDFPTPTGGQFFYATIQNPANDTDFEIVKCTAVSVNTCTIERAQEGTSAQEWANGSLFELRLTSGGIDALKTHQADHISGGATEIDGDQLDIDYSPTYYTPADTPAEVDAVAHLSAHLYGIDQRVMPATQDTYGTIQIATHTEAKDGTDTGTAVSPSALAAAVRGQSWTQEDGYYIGTDKVRARDADGLDLEDDGGNGIHVADGGDVAMDGGLAVAGGIDSTAIGGTTPATGAFTTIAASGNITPDILTASKLIATDASKNLASVEPTVFETGGAQEIDGDKLDVDFTPTNYTPAATPAEADHVDNLTSHLYGLDQAVAGLVSSSVADDGEITLDTGKTGWGFAQAGDNEEWIQFCFTAAGVVTVIANSANAVNTDTDGNLCVYDAGTGIAIKNRLGASKTIRYEVHYSA